MKIEQPTPPSEPSQNPPESISSETEKLIRNSQPLAEILKTLATQEETLFIATLKKLEDYPAAADEAVPLLIERLKESGEFLQQKIVTTLQKITFSEEKYWPILLQLLQDNEIITRQSATKILAKFQSDPAKTIARLTDLFQQDSQEEVRLEALRSLLNFENPIPTLLTALQDHNWKIRKQAATLLGQVDNETSEIPQALIQALQDSNNLVQEAAIQSLLKRDQESNKENLAPKITEKLKKLLQQLHTTNDRECVAAIVEIVKMKPKSKKALKELAYLLKDAKPKVRSEAAWALGEFGAEAYLLLPRLKKVAEKDPNNEVKFFANESIGKIETAFAKNPITPPKEKPQSLSVLVEAIQSEDTEKSIAVILALGKLGTKAQDAVPALIEALKNENENIRCEATWALGEMGSSAREAVPLLKKILFQESNKDVRHFAKASLKKIIPNEDLQKYSIPRKTLDEKVNNDFRKIIQWFLFSLLLNSVISAMIPTQTLYFISAIQLIYLLPLILFFYKKAEFEKIKGILFGVAFTFLANIFVWIYLYFF